MNEENKSYRAILIVIAAILIVVAVIGSYVLVNRVPPLYSGQVLSVNIFPIHRDLSQKSSTEGMGGQNEVYDQMLVLADVRIENTAKIPLFLHDMWAMVNLPDESDRSTAASATDFEKVFVAYPELRQYRKNPLPRDITLQPGQQIEGMMVFNYQMDLAHFGSRSGMDITISFLHQSPLVLHIPK